MDDPFTIPIVLHRHSGYTLPVEMEDEAGGPYNTAGYLFRLEIAEKKADRSWASPPAWASQQVCGSGDSGTVFVIDDLATGSLNFQIPYLWRVLMQAPGAAPFSLLGGSCTVIDGPTIPEINPLEV